ncbi:MAG TPA: PH domain-containing protein, partial [Candidatus Binataceae bacterium]|nr:PH domain-containing protein [Candidatus Binataceae bacterium]
MFAPKPAAVREYMLIKLHPSLWHYAPKIIAGCVFIIAGMVFLVVSIAKQPQAWPIAFVLMGAGAIAIIAALIGQRRVTWTVTSDRIVFAQGLLAKSRREMELADIRSVEVAQRLGQRMRSLGDITIASAASADFAIRMFDVRDPNKVAETVRQARLKRLA